MGVLDVLRKLGILRFGAESAVYTGAAGRPLSLMEDDVLDSKKDVVELKFGKKDDGRENAAGG
jgi:hypothetical protein